MPESLQWGHDFAAVEMLAESVEVGSMGDKLQWGHDFAAVEMVPNELFVY